MKTIYLAGPEVFIPNGKDIIEHKRNLCRKYGFQPASPVDLGARTFPTKFERGLFVSAANEDIMRRADVVIANLTPFRGVSADVGTVYELGFMRAMGKMCMGFTNTGRLYLERVKTDFYHEQAALNADDRWIGADGHRIEDHDMADNLMIDGGIATSGGAFFRFDAAPDKVFEDFRGLEACLEFLASH